MARVKNPEIREIAASRQGQDITRVFVNALAQPGDSVLAAKGGGLELYEELLREPQVYACLQQRRLALVAREWEVVPGADDAQSVKAADFAREMIGRLGWDRVTAMMHYGVFYGYAMAEMLYARDGAYWSIDQIKVRKARRFRFGADGRPRLLTRDNRDGIALPERKFWAYAAGADTDDEPYGLGLGHYCYWPVWFLRNGLKFWAVYLEKFGAPTPVGKYGAGASQEEQKKLLAAVSAVHTDSGLVIPDSMMIDLLEATRGGSADYGVFHAAMEGAIAKVILSQTMTTDDGASLAQGKVHADVKDEVVKADADLICGSFNRGPMQWLTDWNFEGAAAPKIWRVMTQPEDLNTRADRDLKLFQMGFAPDDEYMLETYGPGWARIGAAGGTPAPGTPAPGPDEQGALFAEDALTPEQLRADRLKAQAEAPVAGWLGALKKAVDEAGDLAALRARIEALRDELDIGDMAAAMQKALAAAKLAGRADILAEAAGDGG